MPVHEHPAWSDRFDWLVQGTTGRGDDGFDLRFFGPTPSGSLIRRWRTLREATGCPSAAHAFQVHGARVLVHDAAPAAGLLVADDADGHATHVPGLLLTISVADCVPAFVVDPERRAVALLHAGWRGAAAGILERGIETLGKRYGSRPGDLLVHFGPSICGDCYEVGPEVHRALGLGSPDAPRPVDLRGALADRALALGVDAGAVTISEHCTRCGDSPFYSHRAGHPERQVAFLGIRPGS